MYPDDSAPALPNEAYIPTPSLGATLRADFDALKNDFEQASELASDFQRQLAGKSNEFAELKRLFDKTSQDFVRLQADIAALREERHQLANEAMKVTALEFQLHQLNSEREQLKKELLDLRAKPMAASQLCNNPEHKKQIVTLTAEIEELKRAAQRPSHNGSGLGTEAMELLQAMSESILQIKTLVEKPNYKPTVNHPRAIEPPAEKELIEISFTV